MANEEHVRVVKQGAEVIRNWRRENPGTHLDLIEANLEGDNLNEAPLSDADLTRANLRNATLRKADLTAATFDGAKMMRADMNGADMRLAKLAGADLSSAVLSGCDLNQADLQSANLMGAVLHDTSLRNANLSSSNLVGTTLNGVILVKADLRSSRVDSTTRFNSIQETVGCRVDRYTLEYMRVALKQHQMMDMRIYDDIAMLRARYSGVWRWLHVLSMGAFFAPYAWFCVQQWSVARFYEKVSVGADSIALWRALGRYIWNGGVSWREGLTLNAWSFGCFCVVCLYNIFRLILLWKTKKLETQQEVSGLPVRFSLHTRIKVAYAESLLFTAESTAKNSQTLLSHVMSLFVELAFYLISRIEDVLDAGRWLIIHRITSGKLYWCVLIAVIINSLHFMTMRVPVALPN